ncbi:MAG: hypothetical protein IJN07_01460 [Clostridia bacterium]|nr:hypothetical protein [Clostridia bacterium]
MARDGTLRAGSILRHADIFNTLKAHRLGSAHCHGHRAPWPVQFVYPAVPIYSGKGFDQYVTAVPPGYFPVSAALSFTGIYPKGFPLPCRRILRFSHSPLYFFFEKGCV